MLTKRGQNVLLICCFSLMLSLAGLVGMTAQIAVTWWLACLLLAGVAITSGLLGLMLVASVLLARIEEK